MSLLKPNVLPYFVGNSSLYYYSTSPVLLDDKDSDHSDQSIDLQASSTEIKIENKTDNLQSEVKENVITIETNNNDETKDSVFNDLKDFNLERVNPSYPTRHVNEPLDQVNDDFIKYQPEQFSLIKDTDLMIEESNNYYNHYCVDHRRNNDFQDDLSFIKSRSIAQQQLLFTSLYYKWNIRVDLYKMYVDSVYRVINTADPVSESHLKDLSLAVVALRTNHDLPLFNMMPNKTLTIGKVVYGLSHASNDLVHFYSSKYKTIIIRFKYDTRKIEVGSVLFSAVIDFKDDRGNVVKTIESNLDLRRFSLMSNDKIGNYINDNSGFLSSSYSSELSQMYNVRGNIDISFNNMGSSERRSVIFRNNKGSVECNDAVYIANSITENLTVPLHNDVIVSQMSSLFLINDSIKNHIDEHLMSQYLATSAYEYVKRNIHTDSSTFITNMNFELELTRNLKNEELYDRYQSNIQVGRFVPISPVHYYSYFNGIPEDWRVYSFLTTLACPSINRKLISVMPYLNSENKNYFISYAITRDKLGSYYYDSYVRLPYQQESEIVMSFNSFIKEMWVRTMLKKDIPEFYLPISAGRWVGTANRSTDVSPPSLNPIICKLSMSEFNSKMHELTKQLTFGTYTFRCPDYIKSGYRLSRFIPDVFCRFLPNMNGYNYPVKPKPKSNEVEL